MIVFLSFPFFVSQSGRNGFRFSGKKSSDCFITKLYFCNDSSRYLQFCLHGNL